MKRVCFDENERMTEGQDEGASEIESGTKLSTNKNYWGLKLHNLDHVMYMRLSAFLTTTKEVRTLVDNKAAS